MRGDAAIGIGDPALDSGIHAPPRVGAAGVGAAGCVIVEAALAVAFKAIIEREGRLLDDQRGSGACLAASAVADDY